MEKWKNENMENMENMENGTLAEEWQKKGKEGKLMEK